MNLIQAAEARGILGVVGECGGSMSCATCHVVVARDWADRAGQPGAFEEDILDITEAERQPTSRLSCQIRITVGLDGILVSVPAP
jgi:2Fe-2S ferredoxin